MVIQHNLLAMNSNRMLKGTTRKQRSSTEKLSTGYKINRAADDAAGLSISEKMRKQIRGLTQASANAEDGISCVQTAEGALAEVHDMLHRMTELAVKAANDTNSEEDRSYIQEEIDQLVSEVDRVAETTKFNELYLLRGKVPEKESDRYQTGIDALVKYTEQSTASVAFRPVQINEQTGTAGIDAHAMQARYWADGSWASAGGGAGDVELVFWDVEFDDPDNGPMDFRYIKNVEPVNGYTGEIDKEKFVNTVNEKTVAPAKLYSNLDEMLSDIKEYMQSRSGNSIKDITWRAGDEEYSSAQGTSQILPSDYCIVGFSFFAETTDPLVTSLHVGGESVQDNKVDISIVPMTAKGLGLNGLRVDGEDGTRATAAIDLIADAVQKVSTQRSVLGAVQNRLEHTIGNLDNIVENTTSAESQIRDTDMAAEMVKYSNGNILAQAGQAMLTQANQLPQGILSLLQ